MMPDKVTADGYEQQMQTNHLSHFLLTSLLMPALEAAAAARGEARVVNHSSAARKSPPAALGRKYFEKGSDGKFGGDGTNARQKRYQQSKLANVVFTGALQVCASARTSVLCSVLVHTRADVACSALHHLTTVCSRYGIVAAVSHNGILAESSRVHTPPSAEPPFATSENTHAHAESIKDCFGT